MPAPALDNPFWASLCSRHRQLALGGATVKRYPAHFAPFLGVASADTEVDDALAGLVDPGETVLLLGVVPRVSKTWRLEPLETIAQMQCDVAPAVPDGPEIVPLGEVQRPDVLALTALVYPHYFRERTMELGRYFGIYLPDGKGGRQLASMIGERLGTDDATELSAICTHPDFTGRGYAHRLTAFLTRDLLERGRTTFLHVSHANPQALAVYRGLGYRIRRELPFWSLQRVQATEGYLG